MKRVFSSRYDLQGLGILRTARLMFTSKIFPLGNFSGGAGGRCLLVLAVLHTIGPYVFSFYTRNEEKLRPLIYRLKKLKG